MTRAAIISTTINAMPNMRAWAEQMSEDDIMIIAGDLKSPHDQITRLASELAEEFGADIVYLSPSDQRERDWSIVTTIDWNCIQRRNVALLEAIMHKPKFILTIDDDNYPNVVSASGPSWIDRAEQQLFDGADRLYTSTSGWYNPGQMCSPTVIHRGFPLSQRHSDPWIEARDISPDEYVPVGVFAAMWFGDPDVDALERIVRNPEVYGVDALHKTLSVGTWAPFNSQATAYRTELAPLMFCPPGIGRMDDIWASYVARSVMDHLGVHARYGWPTVRQTRNEHDLVKDLEAEIIGYRHTDELTATLRSIEYPASDRNVLDMLFIATSELSTLDFVPYAMSDAYEAWIIDLAHDVPAAATLFEFPVNGLPND